MTAATSQAAWDALRRERDELAAQVEATNALMAELLSQLGERENRNGDAPGHSHQVPGVWDGDNGALAGKPCAWCATWKHAKAMRSSPNTAADILRQRDARVLRTAVDHIEAIGKNGAKWYYAELRDLADELELKNAQPMAS